MNTTEKEGTLLTDILGTYLAGNNHRVLSSCTLAQISDEISKHVHFGCRANLTFSQVRDLAVAAQVVQKIRGVTV